MADVDPGNFATNFQGGVQFGHLLLWVVLAANVIAMLIQYLSAKLGIAPDRNLAENFRAHYPRGDCNFNGVTPETEGDTSDRRDREPGPGRGGAVGGR